MKTITILISSTLTLLFATLSCVSPSPVQAHAAAPVNTAAPRIGIFDSRGVALAYGRSSRPDCMLAQVAKLTEANAKADTAGDEAKIKQLAAQAVVIQEKIHDQVFDGGVIDEILAMLEDDMPSIAKAAKVDLIIGMVLHKNPGVELIDITYHMCTPFEPDDKTRKMISELIAK